MITHIINNMKTQLSAVIHAADDIRYISRATPLINVTDNKPHILLTADDTTLGDGETGIKSTVVETLFSAYIVLDATQEDAALHAAEIGERLVEELLSPGQNWNVFGLSYADFVAAGHINLSTGASGAQWATSAATEVYRVQWRHTYELAANIDKYECINRF